MNLIERLRAPWRKPDNKPPEMEEAADRIEALEAHNAVLRNAVLHAIAMIGHPDNIATLQETLTYTPESSLADIRRAERERVAEFVDDNCTYGDTHILVKAIRQMED